jgi:hypothetical protein
MIRYLAITLTAGLLCLVLWLPASHPAAQFYRSALAEHNSCSDFWGRQFATAALGKALAGADIKRQAAAPSAMPTGPTGPAEHRLAGRMQDMMDRFHGTPYMSALEAMAALAYYRLATLLYLLPGAGLLLFPALLDAAARRVIRTYEFRRHDPERYSFAMAGAMIATVAVLASCVLPLPLPPMLVPCAMISVIYCLHVVLTNFHHSGL